LPVAGGQSQRHNLIVRPSRALWGFRFSDTMSNPYIRIKCKSVQYLRGFIGYNFTIAFNPISVSGSPVSQNIRLERGETKLLDLEIIELSSNATFNPFTDTFRLESQITESGSDETFPDNALTAFELSPPINSGEDLSPNWKTWIHEREQIIEETGGNQYTTPDATLKYVFEIEIKQSVGLTPDEQNNFPFGINGGLNDLLQDKMMASRIVELRDYARSEATGISNFCDFRNVLTSIDSINSGGDNAILNDFEKMVVWLEVFQYHIERIVLTTIPLLNRTVISFPHLDLHGLASGFSSGIDTAWDNVPAHIVIPVEDQHHGLASHISHDSRVSVPTEPPSWAEPNQIPIIGGSMEGIPWWNSWPTLDSAIVDNDPTFISQGYLRIYNAERNGTIEDARASLGTIEAFRAYRKSGFSSYTASWIGVFIDPQEC